MRMLLREVITGQPLVELVSDSCRPVRVERLPTIPRVNGRLEMIEQRHRITPSSSGRLIPSYPPGGCSRIDRADRRTRVEPHGPAELVVHLGFVVHAECLINGRAEVHRRKWRRGRGAANAIGLADYL